MQFNVKIASTGDTFLVPIGKSILDVLYENKIGHPSSCKVGMCTTCS